MDEDGVANARPCACPLARDSRTHAPYDESRGCHNQNGENMNGNKIVPAKDSENGDVNVINARRLCIHCRLIDRAAVKRVVRDYPVIAFIAIVQLGQERWRTQDYDDRDDDHVDPAALTSRHKGQPCSVAATGMLRYWYFNRLLGLCEKFDCVAQSFR
jgi:hypothetical protein